MKPSYITVEKEEKIETSVIEKEEEIHLLICNRVWMKDIRIHYSSIEIDWTSDCLIVCGWKRVKLSGNE